MKYSDVRVKFAEIMVPIVADDTFSEIYKNTIETLSESDLALLMFALSYETKLFIHAVLSTPNEKLKKLYKKTNPKIIVCFYLRYWNAINLLKEHPDNSIELPEKREELVEKLLFDFVER